MASLVYRAKLASGMDGCGIGASLSSGEIASILPSTAADLATAMGNASCTASYIWLCQEASGNLVDSIAGEELVPANTPLQGQDASSLASGLVCVEFANASNQEFASASTTLLDGGASDSIAVLVIARTTSSVAARRHVVAKSAGANGYYMSIESSGRLQTHTSDGVAGVAITAVGDYRDGDWHVFVSKIDRTAGEIQAITEDAQGTGDISARGSFTNATPFAIGKRNSLDSFPGQIAYVAVFEGAAAIAVDLSEVQALHATL